MKRKKIFLSALLLVIGVLIVTTLLSGGVDNLDQPYTSNVYATIFALFPPAIAILLALITKEVYSSLFFGIIVGALLYSNFNLERMIQTMFFNEDGGMIYKLADSWNVGILVFLVVLGILVALMNKAGGSAAFGRWASKHIKTRIGAQMSTMALGILIFVDDYFNCLTVGSVMRPVTDTHKVSRAKLSYIIDATAAPVCIIAPISSWAAAVTSSVPEDAGINGFTTFLRTIPYNFYAILTLLMIVYVTVNRVDYGPMRKHEMNAINGDLFTTKDRPYSEAKVQEDYKGGVIDLVLPVMTLIISCIICMLYSGGFFSGVDFITAFANANASIGLVMGSMITLVLTFFFYLLRDIMSFKDFMECIPEGFKAMVAPILILTLAWTLSGMTNLLGADNYVADLVAGWASSLQAFLPAIIFVVALGLAFATGTSWGTFGILIPIVIGIFPSGEMMILSISACLAGAVCGDHCSPISDTTIMASAGGQCNHVNHVTTQIPYALTVAAVSFVSYIIAGFIRNPFICLAIAIALLWIVLTVISKCLNAKEPE